MLKECLNAAPKIFKAKPRFGQLSTRALNVSGRGKVFKILSVFFRKSATMHDDARDLQSGCGCARRRRREIIAVMAFNFDAFCAASEPMFPNDSQLKPGEPDSAERAAFEKLPGAEQAAIMAARRQDARNARGQQGVEVNRKPFALDESLDPTVNFGRVNPQRGRAGRKPGDGRPR